MPWPPCYWNVGSRRRTLTGDFSTRRATQYGRVTKTSPGAPGRCASVTRRQHRHPIERHGLALFVNVRHRCPDIALKLHTARTDPARRTMSPYSPDYSEIAARSRARAAHSIVSAASPGPSPQPSRAATIASAPHTSVVASTSRRYRSGPRDVSNGASTARTRATRSWPTDLAYVSRAASESVGPRSMPALSTPRQSVSLSNWAPLTTPTSTDIRRSGSSGSSAPRCSAQVSTSRSATARNRSPTPGKYRYAVAVETSAVTATSIIVGTRPARVSTAAASMSADRARCRWLARLVGRPRLPRTGSGAPCGRRVSGERTLPGRVGSAQGRLDDPAHGRVAGPAARSVDRYLQQPAAR